MTEMEVIPANRELLQAFEAGHNVLTTEAGHIRATVDALSWLSEDPADRQLLPLAAEMATEGTAMLAVDILPSIQVAVRPFTPQQANPDMSGARWTMDWGAIGKRVDERVAAEPELSDRLTDWFRDTTPELIETSFGTGEIEKTYVIIGGANDQPAFRAILALADMASPEFRAEHGLVTSEGRSLQGEDGRDPGWLQDQEFITLLREHVKERIAAGEVNPRLLVLGSAKRPIPDMRKKRDGTMVRNEERDTVAKYLDPEVTLLYPDQGVTEADAMLGGALMVFEGDASTIEIADIPGGDPQAISNKLISFDSAFGRVHMVATLGDDAHLLRQVEIAGQQIPELFEGVEAVYGTTTGIYTRQHRPALREAIGLLGFKGIKVDALGISAHAAGMTRKLETLVGELTKYLEAIYRIAVRVLENAELNTKLDGEHLAALGGTALNEAGAS